MSNYYGNQNDAKYYIKDYEPDLPKNWEALFYFCPSFGWGNLYAMFLNESRKELVIGIRGTDNVFNLLSDAKLVVGAFSGNYTAPLGQKDVENLANCIHYNEKFKTANRSDFYLIKDIATSILQFETEVSPYISNFVIAQLYVSAITIGIFSVSQVVPLGIVAKIGASIVGSTLTSLNLALNIVRGKLIKLLNEALPPSINTFTKSINVALNTRFKGYRLKIVGHSLGATMAELCAFEVGAYCIGFESPGSLEVLENIERYQSKLSNDLKITNYMSAPNIINTLNGHPGDSYRMFLPHTDGSFSKLHAANCVLQSASRLATYASFGVFTYGKYLVQKGVETALVQTSVKTAAGAAVSKAAGGIIVLWKDLSWLKMQHGIDKIVVYLKETNSVQIKKVISWPHLLFGSRLKHEVIEFVRSAVLPLQKDLPGFRNMLDEEGMHEAQINRIKNYEVIN